MIVEVIDEEGAQYEGRYVPHSVFIETTDLKTPSSPCYQRLERLLGYPPPSRVLDRHGSARNGRIHW
jgi:hypothetical protein